MEKIWVVKWIDGSGGEQNARFTDRVKAEEWVEFIWKKGFRVVSVEEEKN
jgi:hypothetical protein